MGKRAGGGWLPCRKDVLLGWRAGLRRLQLYQGSPGIGGAQGGSNGAVAEDGAFLDKGVARRD